MSCTHPTGLKPVTERQIVHNYLNEISEMVRLREAENRMVVATG